MEIVKSIICVSLVSASFLAYASDLKITNRTKYNLSFKINNACSSKFGNVNNHSAKVVPEADFNKACEYNPSDCFVTAYNKTNCQGENLAEIIFDMHDGIKTIKGPNSNDWVEISGSEFNLVFASPFG